MREDVIHYAIRRFLKDAGWQLIAGQYPNGSDDELSSLNIVDPILARDNSPDPRRHSKNKLVPDLVACKHQFLLIIEMKPSYSGVDERKLENLLTDRYNDFLSALQEFVSARGIMLPAPIQELTVVPCLGFGVSSGRYQRKEKFCHFVVEGMNSVIFEGNAIIPII